MRNVWNMKFAVVPVIAKTLEIAPKKKRLEELEKMITDGAIQTTALLKNI